MSRNLSARDSATVRAAAQEQPPAAGTLAELVLLIDAQWPGSPRADVLLPPDVWARMVDLARGGR